MSECKNKELGNLLFAYELNGLDEKETERFETHLLECEYCYNELKSFEREASLLGSDEDVKGFIHRAAGEKSASGESLMARIWKYLWPETPIVLKPALAYFVILLLIIPAYWGIDRPEESSIRPVQVMNLLPGRSADESTFKLTADQDGMLSFVFRGSVPGKNYQVILESQSGSIIFEDNHYNRFDEYETGRLLLPYEKMKPGRYRLTIIDPSAEPPTDRQVRSFRIAE